MGSSTSPSTSTAAPLARRLSRTGLALAAIVVLALGIRVAHFAAIAPTAFPDLAEHATEADMFGHLEWSDRILDGDWLGRDTYHHYPSWTDAFPKETWHRWWGGEEIFHREPFYPYFLALVRGVVGRDSLRAPLFFQLLLGALQPCIAFALARRLFDARAGLLAALITALYGPFVFFQGTLLRDWLPPIVEPLVLVLALRAGETRRPRDWLLAGALLGVAILLRSTMLLFVPLMLGWALWRMRAERGDVPREARSPAARAVLAAAAGTALVLMPLVLRNAIVGAPLLALQNRAPEAIAESFAADTNPIGMFLPPSMPGILEKAQGRAGVALAESLATWKGDWAGFARMQWLKLQGVFSPLEISDNLSYDYGRELSPVLRATLGFAPVAALGVAGLVLAFRRRREHVLVLGYLAITLGGLMVVLVISRYRLALAALLAVYAAGWLVACLDAARARRFAVLVPLLLLVPLLVAFRQATVPEVLAERERERRATHLESRVSLGVYLGEQRFEEALAETARMRRRAAGDREVEAESRFLSGVVEVAWAEAALARGEREEIARHLARAREAFGPDPAQPVAWIRIGKLHAALGETALARTALERYLAVDPAGPAAGLARELLAKLEPAKASGG